MKHAIIGAAILFLTACGERAQQSSASDEVWQYPIRIGDGKAKVHEILGLPEDAAGRTEEYPRSGVKVRYDAAGKVSELRFSGDAAIIFTSTDYNEVTSGVPVVFGLTARGNEENFRRVLGNPVRSSENERRPRVFRCVWKRDGYVIDAQFLHDPHPGEGKTFPVGSLLVFEIARGL